MEDIGRVQKSLIICTLSGNVSRGDTSKVLHDVGCESSIALSERIGNSKGIFVKFIYLCYNVGEVCRCDIGTGGVDNTSIVIKDE